MSDEQPLASKFWPQIKHLTDLNIETMKCALCKDEDCFDYMSTPQGIVRITMSRDHKAICRKCYKHFVRFDRWSGYFFRPIVCLLRKLKV